MNETDIERSCCGEFDKPIGIDLGVDKCPDAPAPSGQKGKITVAEARKKAIDHLHRVDARLAEERKVEDTVTITRADYERLLADSERLDDVIELGLRVYHCLDGHWHVLPVGGNEASGGGLDYWTSGRAALDAAKGRKR